MTINIPIHYGVVCWIFDAHNPAKMGACRVDTTHSTYKDYGR